MEDYQTLLTEALTYLNARAAVTVLNHDKKSPDLNLDVPTKLKLGYVRMMSLTEGQLLQLIKNSIILAYTLPEFNLSKNIESFTDQLMDPNREIDFYRSLVNILENHQENIFSNNIVVNSISVPGTLQNWIKDYLANTGNAKQRDALAIVKYINNSGNAKSLNEEQRKVLKDIIKIYDKAWQEVNFWDNLEVPKDQKELYKDYDLYSLIPDLEEDKEDDGSLEAINQSSSQPAINVEESKTPIQQEPATLSKSKIPLQKNLDIGVSAPQQKRGLIFDVPTNIDLDKEAEARKGRDVEQDQIQAKLEELKKRKK